MRCSTLLYIILPAGNGKCIGYPVWAGLWCKAISYAWYTYAKGYVGPSSCKYSSGINLGLHQPNSNGSWSKSRNIYRSWSIRLLVDSRPFCLWLASMLCQVSAKSKHSFSSVHNLWDYNIIPPIHMLDSSL